VKDPEHPPQKFSTYKKAFTDDGNDSDKFNDIPVAVIEEVTDNSAICILSNTDISVNNTMYTERIAVHKTMTET
jgi:hypothetical protein